MSTAYLFRDEGRRYAGVMIDLQNASRDELIRLIVSQHETIARQEGVIAAQQERMVALEATVARLTAQVGEVLATVDALRRGDAGTGSGRPPGMPGLKPTPTKERPPKKARKRREQPFVRYWLEPTQQVVHAVEQCPTCGLLLTGGSVKRTREVIEVPLVPVVVTEHIFLERCCPHYRTRHTPAVALSEAVVGKQRFGVRAGQPDRDAAGGSAAARRNDPVVSGNGACPLDQCGGNRRGVAASGTGRRGNGCGDPGGDSGQSVCAWR